MTLSRLMRGKLRRHGKEAIPISIYVALKQCNDVARGCHRSVQYPSLKFRESV